MNKEQALAVFEELESIKNRMKNEGSQTVTKCNRLKMIAEVENE